MISSGTYLLGVRAGISISPGTQSWALLLQQAALCNTLSYQFKKPLFSLYLHLPAEYTSCKEVTQITYFDKSFTKVSVSHCPPPAIYNKTIIARKGTGEACVFREKVHMRLFQNLCGGYSLLLCGQTPASQSTMSQGRQEASAAGSQVIKGPAQQPGT